MITRRWQIAAPSADSVKELCDALKLPPLLATCLLNRGCATPDAAGHYLEPRLARLSDPFLLPNMSAAVDRLFEAHARKECFVIFGDYDVDGVTATALLTEFFRELGWECVYYLPHRLEEGYGLSSDGVANCLARHQVKLLIAVDCGSKDSEVIADLRARGVEVIVLDHHQVGSPLPAATALVNPQLLAAGDDLKNLCSAGLAFKLAHAVLKRARTLGWAKANEIDLRDYLDLVALGTIADIVPLQGENRTFARVGLEKLHNTNRIGLKALKQVAGINETVTSYEVSFQLAPRLNAAGRLETAMDALELLLTRDPAQTESLAKSLDAQNRERQSLEQKIAEEVIEAVRTRFNPETDYAIVEGNAAWHLGVVGIVASRVLREFHRPVLILGSDGSENWRGSGRSIEGFDLAGGLRQCADLLLKHGGHAMAAGLTIASGRFADLRTRFNNLVRSTISADALSPVLRLDAEVALADLTFDALKLLEKIDPIGQGNPPIQFAARRLQLRGEPKRFGSAQQHLRFSVSDGQTSHQALWWNCGEPELPERFDLAFAPELSEYNGTFGIQLKVLDLRPATA
jgi:single-stranded-DNA-specific exonuclease